MQEAPKTVKLSKQTVNFLKNFSTINKSILIKAGNFIDTISVNKNIISFTDIKEYIPVDMAIYDLPLFLGALSLFETPTLFFPDEKKVIIYDENTKGKTTYYYRTLISYLKSLISILTYLTKRFTLTYLRQTLHNYSKQQESMV